MLPVVACDANDLLTIHHPPSQFIPSAVDGRRLPTSRGRYVECPVCPFFFLPVRPSVRPSRLGNIRSCRQKDEAQLDQRGESAGQTCARFLSLALLILLLLHHPPPLGMTLAARSTLRRTSREPSVMDGEGENQGRLLLLNVSRQCWHGNFLYFLSHSNVSGETKRKLSEEAIGFNSALSPVFTTHSTKPPDLTSCDI